MKVILLFFATIALASSNEGEGNMYFDVFNGSVAVNHTLSTRQVHYKLFNEGSARIKVVETRRGWGFIKEIGLDAHEEFDLSGYTSDTTSYEIYLTNVHGIPIHINGKVILP